jgi:hypothetical protein
VPVTCKERQPSKGRWVNATFDARKAGPRALLKSQNSVMVGDNDSGTQGGTSERVSGELLTTPKGAKTGKAKLFVDFTHPAMTVRLNGSVDFDVCSCTGKDCL